MNSTLSTAKFVELNYFPFGTWSNNIYFNVQAPLVWTIASTDYTSFATWEAIISEVNSANSDPLFTSAPTDLTVLVGSPAIDNGLNLVPFDFDHIRRPRDTSSEIGAYEYIIPIPPEDLEVSLMVGINKLNPVTRIGYFN